MRTEEQNRILTQVGKGTLGGELLRRYWHPIAIAADVFRGENRIIDTNLEKSITMTYPTGHVAKTVPV
jgi:hypothetical protein